MAQNIQALDTIQQGMTEGEAVRCVAECQTSEKDYCECKCLGLNHGIGTGRKSPAIMLGIKRCQCGCGEETLRRFVPGHDARYHAAQKAKAAGFGSVEEWRKANRKAANDRAAAKRREQRAVIKVGADKIAAAAKAGTLVTGSKPRIPRGAVGSGPARANQRVVVSPKGDDLPF